MAVETDYHKIKKIFTQSSAEQTSLYEDNVSKCNDKVNADALPTKYSIQFNKNNVKELKI